ncbi:hypothetical protein GCM10029976_066760 [Kribbella albertanoniae]|uniref:Uncharacterized protein n=1 Tax=Kribbella albertanoniae TaxID=1266829 RepID=A0A4R4QJ06_9ACTN|nr:hypothetical protein [Kribbella albertanoniae]TDC35791.1 hypothetical protein E1261_00230 [Kribbella albertanoniae]
MEQRPAPARLPDHDVTAIIDNFTETQRRAIATTLDDLRGWATLHGTLNSYDSHTGAKLDPPVRLVGWYDRDPRRGLPDNWTELFISLGWLDLSRSAYGTAWFPTTAGLAIRDEWLPAELRNRRG